MFRKVVVALDGSDLAERSVPLAESLAHEAAVEVILVEVVPSAEMLVAQTTDAYTGAAASAVDVESLVEASRREVGEYLRGLVERLKSVGVDARAEVGRGRCGRWHRRLCPRSRRGPHRAHDARAKWP